MPNPGGQPEKWGQYLEGKFQWNLKIKAEGSFRTGFGKNSNQPRFDARVGHKGDYHYINPYNGEIGNRETMTHLFLENYFY